MPARDMYHTAVKNALIKDGWTITHDPLTLELGNSHLFIIVDPFVKTVKEAFLRCENVLSFLLFLSL